MPCRPPVSLFTSAPRSDVRLRYAASAYERLDRRAWRRSAEVRSTLDSWYGHLPSAAADEIAGRFADREDSTHLGAFWELYLAESLRRLGLRPAITVGAVPLGRHIPDFRLRRPTSWLLEATVATGADVVGTSERRRLHQLYDLIDEHVRNTDFELAITTRAVGDSTPGRRVAREIDRWLDALDWAQVRQAIDEGGPGPSKTLAWQGWRIDLTALPRSSGRRGIRDRERIASRIEGFSTHHLGTDARGRPIDVEGFARIDDVSPLRRALKAKSGHGYETGGQPFVLAVLITGGAVDDHHVVQALLGPYRHRIPAPGGGSAQPFHDDHGFWRRTDGAPQSQGVSAVLVASGLSPDACAVVEPTLWTNPWAHRQLPAGLLPYRRLDLLPSGHARETPATRTAADVLQLTPGWPVSEPSGGLQARRALSSARRRARTARASAVRAARQRLSGH